MIQHRQGDVLFVKVDVLPDGLAERKSRVIVEGESTGHAHRLTTGIILDGAEATYLNASEGSSVVHEEHHTVELEPGYWQVIRQREYHPEGIRQVLD